MIEQSNMNEPTNMIEETNMTEHANIIEVATLIEDTNMIDETSALEGRVQDPERDPLWYASHPDLRRLPGLHFPGQEGEPVSRQAQVGWQMFFGPTPKSPKHLVQLAAYASRWFKAAVEVLEENNGTGKWDDVLQTAVERLQARDHREAWTAGATPVDRGAVMMTLVGARKLYLKTHGLKVGGLRGKRPRNIPKGFRPFLASLDRWIEASVWLRPPQAISGVQTNERNEDLKTNTTKRAYTPVAATEEPPMKKARYSMSTQSITKDEGCQTAVSAIGYLREDENDSNSTTPPQIRANNVDLMGRLQREVDYEELLHTTECMKQNYIDLCDENKMLRQKFQNVEAAREATRTEEVEVVDLAGTNLGVPEGAFAAIKRRISLLWG